MSDILIKSYIYYRVPAGWRDYLILRIESKGQVIGFSEFTDSNGSEATLLTAIEEIGDLLIGKRIESVAEVVISLRKKYRQSLPGIIFKAISAFENALWDLQSKISSKPIVELQSRGLFNSNPRRFSCYWSHCPTTRIRASQYINVKQILNYPDLISLGKEISELKFSAFKTNLVQINPVPKVWMPGFNKDFNFTQEAIPDSYPEELHSILKSILSQSSELEAIIDLNFNTDLDSYQAIQNSLSDLKIRWIEIDFDDFVLYENIMNMKKYPICTGENLLGLNSFEKIMYDKRVDIVSIDILWNGLTESLKIADLAIACGKKVAVHNYYGSLASSIALVFLSMLPLDSIELMEFDFDDVPWRDSIVNNPPKFVGGSLEYVPGLGWNNDFLPNKLKNLDSIEGFKNHRIFMK
jgi:galactonate dehydratase